LLFPTGDNSARALELERCSERCSEAETIIRLRTAPEDTILKPSLDLEAGRIKAVEAEKQLTRPLAMGKLAVDDGFLGCNLIKDARGRISIVFFS